MTAKVIPPDNLSPEEKKHLPVLKTGQAQEVHLSGVAITHAGQMTQHNYFKFLGEDFDDYTNLSFTEEEATKIRGHLGKMSTGATSVVPNICSPKCAWKARCPLYQMGKAPYMRACLIEVNLIREWITAYFNQYQIDPNNFTEIGMINELAEIEIYQWRLNQLLAMDQNAELIVESIVGFTHPSTTDGISQPLKEKKISPYLEAKMVLAARKTKLIKLMVGDRQEKYKKEAALGQRETSDPSSSMAELRRRLEKLQTDLGKAEIVSKEQSGKIIDVNVVSLEQPAIMSPEDLMDKE